jgi:hypothetical protein
VGESRLHRSLRRQRAIEAAAVAYHGWGRTRGDNKLTPQEHWDASTPDQRAAVIELTTPIIEAYERVMEDLDLCPEGDRPGLGQRFCSRPVGHVGRHRFERRQEALSL